MAERSREKLQNLLPSHKEFQTSPLWEDHPANFCSNHRLPVEPEPNLKSITTEEDLEEQRMATMISQVQWNFKKDYIIPRWIKDSSTPLNSHGEEVLVQIQTHNLLKQTIFSLHSVLKVLPIVILNSSCHRASCKGRT